MQHHMLAEQLTLMLMYVLPRAVLGLDRELTTTELLPQNSRYEMLHFIPLGPLSLSACVGGQMIESHWMKSN